MQSVMNYLSDQPWLIFVGMAAVVIFILLLPDNFSFRKKTETGKDETNSSTSSATTNTSTTSNNNNDPFERTAFDRTAAGFTVRQWLLDEISWHKQEIAIKQAKYNNETPEVAEWLFWVITSIVVILVGGITFLTWRYIPSLIIVSGFELNPQILIYMLVGVYVLAGLRPIDTDKVAGLDFAGTPVRQFGNGLKWYPWLVFRLTIETAQLVQAEAPGDADHIFWKDEEEELPPNTVRPIYVLSGENPDGILPTDKQVNLGVSYMTKFQLVKERFFDLVRNVSPVDPENGKMIMDTMTGGQAITKRLLEVLRHLRDTGSAFAAGILGKLSYNEITAHRHLVDELLKLRVELEMIPWGLELEEARFTQINPGHSYNKDLQRRAEAVTERDRLSTEADGKAAAIEKEGIAAAKARKAMLQAEAEGQKAIRDELGVTGDVAIAAEVAKELAKGGNTVIAPNVAGLGAALQTGAAAVKPKTGGSASPSNN